MAANSSKPRWKCPHCKQPYAELALTNSDKMLAWHFRRCAEGKKPTMGCIFFVEDHKKACGAVSANKSKKRTILQTEEAEQSAEPPSKRQKDTAAANTQQLSGTPHKSAAPSNLHNMQTTKDGVAEPATALTATNATTASTWDVPSCSPSLDTADSRADEPETEATTPVPTSCSVEAAITALPCSPAVDGAESEQVGGGEPEGVATFSPMQRPELSSAVGPSAQTSSDLPEESSISEPVDAAPAYVAEALEPAPSGGSQDAASGDARMSIVQASDRYITAPESGSISLFGRVRRFIGL